jgi:hypothetical protein
MSGQETTVVGVKTLFLDENEASRMVLPIF